MSISTRPATIEDYDGLCEVFEELDAFHREALKTNQFPETPRNKCPGEFVS